MKWWEIPLAVFLGISLTALTIVYHPKMGFVLGPLVQFAKRLF